MPESPLVHVDEPLRLVLTVKHAKLGSVFTSQEFTLVDGSEQPTVSGQRSAFPPRQHFNYQFGTDGMLTPVLPDMAARALGVPKLPFAYTDNVPDDGVLPLGSTLALRFLHYKPFSPAFDMLRWTAVSVHKFAGGDATVQGTHASSPPIFTSMLRAYDAESCESVDRTIEGTRTFRMVEAPMSVPSTLVMPAHCRFPRGDNLHWSGRNFDIVDGQLYAYRVEVPATTLDSAPAGWYYVKIQNSMRLQAPSSERWWMRMAASPLHVFNWLRAQEVVTGFFYVGGVPSSVISLPASPIVDSRDLSDLRGAVLAGDMEWTTSVLDHDQDAARQLASTDLGGKSPLHIAAEHGLYDIVQLLLRHIHANFNRNDAHALIELHDNDGNTALHLSCRQGVALAELLLDYGANANAVNALGDTPLHQCARVGDVDMCRLLLWKGARMDIRNARRDTPLRLALSRVDLVLSKMFIDHQGWTASTIDEEVEGDEEALTWFCDGVRLKVMRMRGGENVPSVRPSLVAAQVLDGWCRAQLARLGRYGFGDLVDAEEAWTWS